MHPDGWPVRGYRSAVAISPDAVPSLIRRGQSGFIEDLGRALRVWRQQPALPLLTTAFAVVAALAATNEVSGGLTALSAIVAFLFFGYVGAERLWYLRAFTGRRLSVAGALRVSLTYWGRFVRLGLLVLLVSIPLYAPTVPALSDAGRTADSGAAQGLPLWVSVYLGVLSLVIDFSLTFVTPALVFSTDRARDAIRIGLRLLRRTIPHALLYVLFPPFAVLLLTRVSSGELGWVGAVLIVVSSLLNLAAKGATAAYYLRVMPTAGPDGDLDRQVT